MILILGIISAKGQDPTPFTDFDTSTPNYIVIDRIVKNERLKLKAYYGQDWSSGSYKGAWSRVIQYWPKNFYYNSSTKYFMHHWFNDKGKLEMTVYKSGELRRAVQNLLTFQERLIIAKYKAMRKASNQSEARAFAKKLGLLEKYFRSVADLKALKRLLKGEKSLTAKGESIYREMMRSLREEGDHMFAAAMLHEGMHAKVDNPSTVYKINKDYEDCKTPIQWDEFRGYMSEIGYHSNYYNWSRRNIDQHMARIGKLLDKLKRIRAKGKPVSKSNLKKLESIKAKIKAHIAIIRVRLREIKQSIDRMKGAMEYFKENYVKKENGKKYKNFQKIKDMVDGMQKEINDFAKNAQKAIDDYEKGLKDLEGKLKLWNEWAACKHDHPPTEKDHEEIMKEFKDVSWPTKPPDTKEEKEEAEDNIRKTSWGKGRRGIAGPSDISVTSRGDTSKIEKIKIPSDQLPSEKTICVSAGIDVSSFKLDNLNSYFSYLNDTWVGDISSIDNDVGYWLNISWITNDQFRISVEYNYFSTSTAGTLSLTDGNYESENDLQCLDFGFAYYQTIMPDQLFASLQFGAGPYWSNYTETENDFVSAGKSTTLGHNASVGLQYIFTHWFEAQASVGYRTAKFDDYNNDVKFFQPTDQNVILDFSGPSVQIGFGFRF